MCTVPIVLERTRRLACLAWNRKRSWGEAHQAQPPNAAAILRNATQGNAILRNATQGNAILGNATQRKAMQCNAMQS
jgi:hypothetical protein